MFEKGIKRTPEQEEKRVEALRRAMKNPDIREKMSLLKLGDNNPMKKEENRKKASEGRSGMKLSKEHRANIGKSVPRGKNHWSWQGGKTSEQEKIRKSIDYKLWREAVFARDDYTCQECGKRGGRLNADHIKPFSLYPELRLDINNGRTLCVDCHKKTDTYLKGPLVKQS